MTLDRTELLKKKTRDLQKRGELFDFGDRINGKARREGSAKRGIKPEVYGPQYSFATLRDGEN